MAGVETTMRHGVCTMRLVICDDQLLFAQAIAGVMATAGHEVVACTPKPAETVQTLARGDIDVCLLRMRFPSVWRVEDVRQMVGASPTTKVVVLVDRADPLVLRGVVAAGARGVARSDHDVHALVDIVERVHRGERVLPAFGQTSRPRGVLGENQRSLSCLTERERQVLTHLVGGYTTGRLAEAMGVRDSTARSHVQSVLRKLGVHTRLEAVAFARRELPHLGPPPAAAAGGRD